MKWNAVLLLDEADVFLAERNLENLSRNALVSGGFLLEDHIFASRSIGSFVDLLNSFPSKYR